MMVTEHPGNKMITVRCSVATTIAPARTRHDVAALSNLRLKKRAGCAGRSHPSTRRQTARGRTSLLGSVFTQNAGVEIAHKRAIGGIDPSLINVVANADDETIGAALARAGSSSGDRSTRGSAFRCWKQWPTALFRSDRTAHILRKLATAGHMRAGFHLWQRFLTIAERLCLCGGARRRRFALSQHSGPDRACLRTGPTWQRGANIASNRSTQSALVTVEAGFPGDEPAARIRPR